MYQNPATVDNLNKIAKRGVNIISPIEGELACKDVGIGKMQEPETIFEAVKDKLSSCNVLNGLKVIVTAGPTIEDIDPVRYISNRSSGKMGYAIAEMAKKMGADVTLISGPSNLKTSLNVTKVKSAINMLNVLKQKVEDCDILIMAAAVADYRVENISDIKIKKSSNELHLKLIKNPDILFELSKIKREGQVFVGFAAESNDLEENAVLKLKMKNLDMIVANDIKREDIAFDSDYNEVIVFNKKGSKLTIKKDKKEVIAEKILKEIKAYING
jgi:phosphopantothenoylcysteine decarboxylase/phosphopantothenate--cysteine ligase